MAKQEVVFDNRMRWILEAEKCEKSIDDKVYYTEYEICSDARIGGILDYGNGFILCSIFQEANQDGLYTYLVRIKQSEQNFEFNKNNYSKEGYAFAGIINELIALFSVYFQARFYHKATITGELSSRGGRSRSEYELIHKKPNIYWHYEMFSKQERNWANGGLKEFLDRIRLIDGKYHQNLIWACEWYVESIKEIGIDGQLFYIKMVSSVEALLSFVELPSDSLEQKLTGYHDFTEEEREQIDNWLKNRKIGKKFKTFLQKYSDSFFEGERSDPAHCCIKEGELDMYAGRIYNARSKYLHNGNPMYISDDYPMDAAKTWDLSPSGEMMIDRKKIAGNEKLPRIRWFELIANRCLKNFICSITPVNALDHGITEEVK